MQNQVTGAEKSRRAAIMDGIKKASKEAYHSTLIGTTQTVLVETCTQNGGGYIVTGHTRSFVPVEIESVSCVSPSEMIEVCITSCDDEGCKGTITL
jgi:tRNA A37 methylthiotransferase MiaB